MSTEVLKITAGAATADAVRRGIDVLARGGLVAMPTETVYGLAARADDLTAMKRLREVKARESGKPFTVHIGCSDDARRYVERLSGLASRLIRKGWPGPLTVVLSVPDPSATPIAEQLDRSVWSSLFFEGAIGLRCPDDPVAGALLRGVDAPVVAASANLAGHPPPRTAEEVIRDLDGRFDLLIDAGATKYAKPSTIVRVDGNSYRVLREGVYDAGIIERLSKLRVLFVCSGNTCRSPMAAAMARRMLAERVGCRIDDLGASGIEVDSAGTSGGYGPASPHASAVVARRGLDLSGHVSKALTPDMIRRADYVFAMTRDHVEAITAMAPMAADRVFRLLAEQDVADPVGGTEEDYERCAKVIEEGLRARLEEIDV